MRQNLLCFAAIGLIGLVAAFVAVPAGAKVFTERVLPGGAGDGAAIAAASTFDDAFIARLWTLRAASAGMLVVLEPVKILPPLPALPRRAAMRRAAMKRDCGFSRLTPLAAVTPAGDPKPG